MRNGTDHKIIIHWLRHGKTAGNLRGCYIGRTDEKLCAAGRLELCEKESVDLVFISPMKRCIESANLVYPGMEPIVIPEFTEMDFGLFEGKNYKDLCGNDYYQKWIDSGGTLPFPEGEDRQQFISRCRKGYEVMLESILAYMKQKKTDTLQVAAVVHGGTIMAVLSSLCGGDYFDYQVGCGTGYRLVLGINEAGDTLIEELVKE